MYALLLTFQNTYFAEDPQFHVQNILLDMFHSTSTALDVPVSIRLIIKKGCGQTVCESNKSKHILDHFIQFKIHCVFINIYSAQIRCLACRIEIYDLESLEPQQYQRNKTNIDPFTFRIKYLSQALSQTTTFQSFGQLQNSEAHKKSRRGLCGVSSRRNNSIINSIVQFISNIPYYKQILKHCKVDSHKNDNSKLVSTLASVVKRIWQGESRNIVVNDLVKLISDRFQKLKSYRRKDPFQLFIYVINCLHEQFKYYECITAQQRIEDEWKILEQFDKKYEDVSYIKSPLVSAVQYTIVCDKCKQTKRLLAQMLSLDLQIPKQKREVKNLEAEFGKYSFESPFKKRRKSLMDRIWGSPEEQIPVTLIQMIISYMTKQLPDQQQSNSCNTCKQPMLIRQAKFKSLPKLLLIQIYRMVADGYSYDQKIVEYPTEILNMKGFVAEGYKGQTVYEFNSAICYSDKTFLTISKNLKNKQLYQFIGQNVKINNGKYCAFLLCYSLRNKQQTLYHNIKSNVMLNISPEIPLPDFWLTQLKNFEPTSLNNPRICKHHKLKPRVESKSLPINLVPKAIFNALVDKFGGQFFDPKECSDCLKEYYAVNYRKRKQKQAVTKFDSYKCKAYCMVSTYWLTKWTQYLYKKKQINYFLKPVPPPPPVNNLVLLLDNGNRCKPNLKKGEDFKVVNFYVWTFFKELYGGGPQIQYKTKVQEKNKLAQLCDPSALEQAIQRAKELKLALTEQFYLNKQWDESPTKLSKSVSLSMEVEDFKQQN